jgi:DNA-binding PucR family transcriptional regulator
VLQTIVDGTLLGVAPRRPTAPQGVALGVGPPVLLSSARESFAEAWEALATAQAFSMTGTFDLTTVGPLALVTIGDHVASRLAADRFVDLGTDRGDIERTVLTLLEFDQNIDRTATELHLHRNTVRYRVTRFRDITGLDLRRTEDLVTAWWLLKWRQARTDD